MVRFGLDSRKFESGIQKMKASTKAFGDDTKKGFTSGKLGFLRAAGDAGVLAGGVAAASFAMYKGTRAAMTWGSTISDQALEAQMSVEKLQTLLGVGLDAGRGADVMLTALRGFNSRVAQAGEGAETYRKEIEKLGYYTEDFINLPVDKRLDALARYYTEAKDKTSAYLTVVKLLGEDAAPKLLEVLTRIGTEGFDKLNEKMEASGRIIKDDVITALDASEDAYQRLLDTLAKVGIQTVGNTALMLGFGKEAGSASKQWGYILDGLMATTIVGSINFASDIIEGMGAEVQSAESDVKTKEALEKRRKNQIALGIGAQEQNLTVAQRASKIKAENNARSLAEQFPQLTKKARSLFSAFDVLASNDGWDKEKEFQEFQATATTSLGAIGGGAVNGMSIQIRQLDIMQKIEQNTRQNQTGASKTL
jgi:hypothetical protein